MSTSLTFVGLPFRNQQHITRHVIFGRGLGSNTLPGSIDLYSRGGGQIDDFEPLREPIHASTSMSCMKNPTKSFCQVITSIDDARAVTQDNVSFVTPFLNGEMMDFNVLCTGSRPILVDHVTTIADRFRRVLVLRQTRIHVIIIK